VTLVNKEFDFFLLTSYNHCVRVLILKMEFAQ